ncbi:MAG TPA: hypothetical protein VKS79_14495 [Gemmataceae bacterium]|nr:hypothetical protein [Gemmataceae bacterium]
MNPADSSAASESGVRSRLLEAAGQSTADLRLSAAPELPLVEWDDDDAEQSPLRMPSKALENSNGEAKNNPVDPSVTAPSLPGLPEQQTDLPRERPRWKCPKCEAPLTAPGVLDYCSACGYSRLLESQAESAVNARSTDEPSNFKQAVQAVAMLPGWLSILLGGAFAILLYCKSLDFLLAEHSEVRAIWGTGLLLAGLVIMHLCQFWAFWKLAPANAGWGITEALVPSAQVWSAAFRRLPHTRWPIWLAGWSLTVVIASILMIGGQTYWLETKPVDSPPSAVAR